MSSQDQTTTNQGGESIERRLATKSIFETLEGRGEHSLFVEALRAAGMEGLLKGSGAFTVFAPPNGVLSGGGDLSSYVGMHVVRGKNLTADMRTAGRLKSLHGDQVAVQVKGADVRYGDTRVESSDIPCTNGVIHIVDGMLNPAEQTKMEQPK